MNKKDFIWNMIGSGLYAAVTFIFTALANWLTDSASAGFFAMTFTTALMMQPLGIFEVRPFQVTDVRFKYQFAHYFSFRLVTCALFLMAGMVYGFITADGVGMFIAVMMVFLFKSADCVGDVFEGEFQRRERMDIAGKSLAYRMVLVIAAYCITIALTKNILAAVTVTAAAAFVGFFLFDIRWKMCIRDSYNAGDLQEGYSMDEVLVTPEKVTISGRASLLDNISSAGVELDVEDLTDNAQVEAPIYFYNAGDNRISLEEGDLISISATVAGVSMSVQKIKELTLDYKVSSEPEDVYKRQGYL